MLPIVPVLAAYDLLRWVSPPARGLSGAARFFNDHRFLYGFPLTFIRLPHGAELMSVLTVLCIENVLGSAQGFMWTPCFAGHSFERWLPSHAAAGRCRLIASNSLQTFHDFPPQIDARVFIFACLPS